MATKKQKAKEMKLRKKVSMMTRTPGVSARQAIKREAMSAGKAAKRKGKWMEYPGLIDLIAEVPWRSAGKTPEQIAEKTKKKAAKAMGKSAKGMGKIRREDLDIGTAWRYGSKGGMVKSYSTGGSVSRGQYPKQTQKVKFKGVF
tara:strand:+ start:54 stop:485 length:432 start_codon:yes stop_codon:yes gene_type:complete